MPILIDPPITPLAPGKEIEAWIAELESWLPEFQDDPEAIQSINEELETWRGYLEKDTFAEARED